VSGLLLNFFECQLKQQTFNIKYLPYSDYQTKESYLLLKNSNPQLCFTRHGEKIYYWQLGQSVVNQLAGTPEVITAGNVPEFSLR
jgi:hypothetical protein